MMKILTLDFDGVICDNIWDSLFTAYNIYLKFNPETRIFDGIKLTFDNFESVKKKHKPMCEKFRSLRIFTCCAKELVICYHIIEENIKISGHKDFISYCDKFDQSLLESYQKEFYAERRKLQESDIEKWFSLSPPFDDILPGARKLLRRDNVFIVTSKDKVSVMKLCSRFEIEIEGSKILDKDVELNKAAKLLVIAKRFNIKNDEIGLVDDLLPHLINIRENGFFGFLATWGYNNKEQQEEAKKMGIVLLNQKNFYEILDKELKR